MPALLRVPRAPHFNFSAIPAVRVMESFAFADSVFAGVQNGVWFYDEFYWSERKGAWGGVLPMPARESVGDLRIAGAARELFGTLAEPLDRVASGAPLVAQGEILYRYNYYELGVPGGASEHRLYSCATGALVAQAGLGGALGVVPDGAYLLWARTFAGEPFNTGFDMARAKDGEWSALRVVVGAGAWSVANGACPSPGAALYRKSHEDAEAVLTAQNEAAFRLVFDPLARCVSASCVLEQALRTRGGQFVAPAGSLLIGGLRASASGPQTALWVLHADGTSRVLGLQTEFTDGVCECAKTNHHASDIVQSPDGDVFVLTECALFRFNPDAITVYEALEGYPAQSKGLGVEAGHPGGNCLRFPSANEMIHWTENFGGVNDGKAWYNRMVRRVAGRDVAGPGTLWHGTNCAELFLGRFWAIRADDDKTLYLDWLSNGRWHRYPGMARDMSTMFWQRLRAVNDTLWVFGFKPDAPVPVGEDAHTTGTLGEDEQGEPISTEPQGAQNGAHASNDVPTCAVADGLTLRDAEFPYFIRRATTCGPAGDQTMFVAARAASVGIGPANRVIEIQTDMAHGGGKGTHICSFWNEADKAFEMSLAAFTNLGGDVAKLPAFFGWRAMSGVDAGGKWKAVATAPATGFWLETTASATTIKFNAKPNGTVPYDANGIWGRLCFDILSDGSIDTDSGPTIEPTCTDAACARASMPEGTDFRFEERRVSAATNPLTGYQITDVSDAKRLSVERDIYPTLWARFDSDAPRNDLSSYKQLINYGRLLIPRSGVKERVEIVVLVTTQNQPVRPIEVPKISRRA